MSIHTATVLQFWSFHGWRSGIKLCYTFLMLSPPDDGSPWADKLRHYKLDAFVSWLLDAGRPLSILAAQALYIGEPFLGKGASDLARLLELDEQAVALDFPPHEEMNTSGDKKA